MNIRARLEAHAARNREELAAGKPRTPLPEDLRDLRGTCLCEACLAGADLCEAVFRWACFVNADLSDANLRGADLRGADLRRADLRWANLRWANLSEADLSGADLRWADLRNAFLRGADLRGADLRGADLTGAEFPAGFRIASLCFGGWPVTATPTTTTIGCQTHPNEKWLSWGVDDPEITKMHENAAAWWKRHREAVCAAIRDVMAEDGP